METIGRIERNVDPVVSVPRKRGCVTHKRDGSKSRVKTPALRMKSLEGVEPFARRQRKAERCFELCGLIEPCAGRCKSFSVSTLLVHGAPG